MNPSTIILTLSTLGLVSLPTTMSYSRNLKQKLIKGITKPGGTFLMMANELAPENCKMKTFPKKIRIAGCKPKIVPVRFCSGTCLSWYIPGVLTTCQACQPTGLVEETVRLDCHQTNAVFETRVEHVQGCSCSKCPKPKKVEKEKERDFFHQ